MPGPILRRCAAAFQRAGVACPPVRTSITVASGLAAPQGLPGPSRAMGAAAALSRRLAHNTASGGAPRDWPGATETQGQPEHITASGSLARQASLQAGANFIENHLAQRNHAYRSGEGIDAQLSALTTRAGMVGAMEHTADEIVKGEGPGIAAGLHALAIAPGDAVAEQDPALPSLAVRLALDGARAFVTLRHPARLREVEGEIEQFRKGRTAGLRRMTLDFKPMFPESFYADSARAVSRQLTALPGPGFSALPKEVGFKALIARGSFDGLELPAIEAALHEAGRVLAPGGGLVFEFTHDAGRPVPAPAGARLRCGSVGFHEIAQAVERAGLGLRSLHVTFRLADDPAREVIPTRRVLPDAHGRIDLNRADAAALSGWNEIAQSDALHGRPVRISVSGVFIKEGQAHG